MSGPQKSPGARTIGERGQRFCHWGAQPLLKVSAEAPADDVRQQAYALMESIGSVLSVRLAEGTGYDADVILDTGTAYILRFAAEAAAAMVGSLEVKP